MDNQFDVLLVALTSVTLLVILGSVYLEIRRQTKPKLEVCFPDGSKRLTYRAEENANIALHIKNIGRLGFPKPAATEVKIFGYVPTTFVPTKLEYTHRASAVVTSAPAGGLFSNMQYMGIDIFALFCHEEEVVTLSTRLPKSTGVYPIKAAIISDQGDLGVHRLEIVVT